MLSAQEAFRSIEQAGLRLRQDEDRLDALMEGAAREITRLRQEQAELFRALARIRLDSLAREPVIGRLDEAESKALAAIERQRQRLEELAKRREELRSEIAAATEDRAKRSDAVRQAAEAISALVEATQARLADDLEWQAQSARLSGAEARAAAAEEKAQRAESDRDEKSRPYLADRLFVYLWERGYGTSRYRGGPLARFGDGFVARVINFEPARRNYFSLTEIPKRLREHADRLKTEAAEEEEKLVRLERAALENAGIKPLEAAQENAERDLDAAEERIAALEAQLHEIDSERQGLLGEEGERGLAGALEELAASLQREDLRELMREALQTPTEEDERIVRRLQEIAAELERWNREAEEARRTMLELTRKRAELERTREEFRQAGYERQGGGFINEKLIGDILGGIIGGVLSSRELRDALRSGYRPGRAGSGFPRPGGFGGGPRRSGGSRTGGGFRTGGSF